MKRLSLEYKAQKRREIARLEKREKELEKDIKVIASELSALKRTKRYAPTKKYLARYHKGLMHLKVALKSRENELKELVA